MTLAPPDRTATTFESRDIDMRCAARTPDVSGRGNSIDAGRCQLLAGHGDEHALMFSGTQEREVLVWTPGRPPQASRRDWRTLAWMRGYPTPAWFETPA